LWGNLIGDEGAKWLSQNTTMIEINLSSNNIGDEGAKFLNQSSSIKTLYVAHNHIGDEGAKCFSTNTVIEVLDITDNMLEKGVGLLRDKPSTSIYSLYGNPGFIETS